MVTLAAVLLVVGAVLFALAIRAKELLEPEALSPLQHLEERKAAIYESLRDLEFEYRVGKLSERDYQQTKQDWQRDLADLAAQADVIAQTEGPRQKQQPAAPPAQTAPPKPSRANLCPHCGAAFAQPLKYCGECGQPMTVEDA